MPPSRRSFRDARRPLRNSFAAEAARDHVFADIKQAIADKDADSFVHLVRAADTARVHLNRATLWRMAGAADTPALLAALWSMDEQRRDRAELLLAGWQGAVNAKATQSRFWLADAARPRLGVEDKASLAQLALRNGDDADALILMADVFGMPPFQREKQVKLVCGFLHYAASQGRSTIAEHLLRGFFRQPGGQVFTYETNAFQNVVIAAAVQGHADTVALLLREGAQYLNDNHRDEMLVAAIDRDHPDVAAVMLRQGANPQAIEGAAMRHAVRHWVAAASDVSADGADGQAAPATIQQKRESLLRALFKAGGRPDVAAAAVAMHAPEDACQAVSARLAAWAAQAAAENAQEIAALPAAREPSGRRRPMIMGSLYESLLHRAARLRVLAHLLQTGVFHPLSAEDWQAKNPAGRSVMTLCIASGETAHLLTPPVWRNNTGALRAFLEHLPPEQADNHTRETLLREVALMDRAAIERSRKLRL